MGHSTFEQLDDSRDQHVYSKLLDEPSNDVLHTLGVNPIRNLFLEYPLWNVYPIWRQDELHQLLLGLVNDVLHWLLRYLKARNVKNQFGYGFKSVPLYLGLQRFSKLFDSMKSSSWQGKEIRCMIRTLAVSCRPILDCSKDVGKDAAKTASDKMKIGAVLASCQFYLLVSQQNHSDRSLTALDDVLNRLYKKNGAFREQNISKS